MTVILYGLAVTVILYGLAMTLFLLCGIVGAGQHFIAVSNFAYFVTQVTRGADQIHHPDARSTQLILS